MSSSSIDKAFKPSCPTCKQPFLGKPLHRYARSHLDEFKFKCGYCSRPDKFAYESLIKHLMAKCDGVKVQCPLQCTEKGNPYIKRTFA